MEKKYQDPTSLKYTTGFGYFDSTTRQMDRDSIYDKFNFRNR